MRGRGLAFVAGRASARNEQAAKSQQSTSSMPTGQADDLEKIVKMHSKGELSDEEFAQAKKKVLSGK